MGKKRGAGEGSIYRRADGRWCAFATVGKTATGKQRRRYAYGATRQEVAEKLRELANAVAEGLVADPKRLRVSDLVERYLEHKKASIRPRVHEAYSQRLHVHVVPRIGNLYLSRLAPIHVLDVASSLRGAAKKEQGGGTAKRAGLATRTQRDVLDVLSRCLDFGVRAGLLPRNPARGLDRPKAEAQKVAALSAAQARRLLSEARKSEAWVEAAVALGLCGLRLGETFGLTWGDVNLETRRVRVRQALAELTDGSREIGPVKTKSARRELSLPSWAEAGLRRHLADLAATPHPTRLIFTTEADSPMRVSNFRRRHFYPLVKRAEIGGTTFHALRHTAATLLLAGGADVKSAQRVLGHAKASHTLDIYADFVPDQVDEAMARLDAALGA